MRTLQPLIFIPEDQAAANREAFADALWRGLWGEGPYQAPGNVIGASGDYLVVQSSTRLV